ncbi:peptidoglycan editing factor PgeF [Candidatus Enterovibrio escicola]|nr:peptidoglycan editing factor PgeF [Candidatus Enterovibrio escacola]
MDWITPNWPAPSNVKAISTTRMGGVSLPPYNCLNLSKDVGDNSEHVTKNRALFAKTMQMASTPVWLNQVHGTKVVTLPLSSTSLIPVADGSYTREVGQVCTIMTADCLPVLFCDKAGTQVAAVHAGWRGLLNGVLEQALSHFTNPHHVMVWLGPALGASVFEVGGEVREQFIISDSSTDIAFIPQNDRWLADIYLLASHRLNQFGKINIYGGDLCTVSASDRFFSYRVAHKTGRQASCIWITPRSY